MPSAAVARVGTLAGMGANRMRICSVVGQIECPSHHATSKLENTVHLFIPLSLSLLTSKITKRDISRNHLKMSMVH